MEKVCFFIFRHESSERHKECKNKIDVLDFGCFYNFIFAFFILILQYYICTKHRASLSPLKRREVIIMDFMKMFMDAINVDVINNMSEEELDKVNAIFAKSDMYKDVETEDEE